MTLSAEISTTQHAGVYQLRIVDSQGYPCIDEVQYLGSLDDIEAFVMDLAEQVAALR